MLQKGCIALLFAAGFTILVSMYLGIRQPTHCRLPPQRQQPYTDPTKLPLLLLWFWPENLKFDPRECQTEFGINECSVTDDRSVYENAEGVLIYHRAIRSDLANLPPRERPPFQKWIWFNVDPPTKTQNLTNLDNLFNLTMSYRKDADITVRVRVLSHKNPEEFVLPVKDKLVCWLSDEEDLGVARDYYKELQKHIKINVFGKAFGKPIKPDIYYSTIASCKFHLSFENSIHPDYITKTLHDPLVSGTIPVVLGPPRKNYEDFIPRDCFIHVNDFPDAKALAESLSHLDSDNSTYQNYFAWRKYLYVRPRQLKSEKQFLHDICLACQHLGRKRVYRRIHDVYKWFYGRPKWLP
ncbi:hypothetical protein AALO_G00033340 [Alosa alosa]|uniref:Fucosyltransferase n=1 Tax=Alosa alosa TaxID=278164 RepID=A0AAV6HCM5_9TELE|nr:4-galactosyl-N-acetylglucosaminide 3-alpha-L-fucosyltransferase 9-like [Alosa alosa]KAG5285033.1 hypothetical protein AALO_G00033340 [Alosa alosa]